MATNVPVPPLGDSINNVVLLRWIKNEGEYVKVDDPIAEIETDKANAELNAPAAGVLHPLKKVGETINVGDVIANIDESATAPATKPAPAAAASAQADSTRTSPVTSPAAADLSDMNPSARRQVIENKLDPAKIPATGPHGRLLGSDVATFVGQGGNGQNGGAAQPPAAAPAPTPPEPQPSRPTPPPAWSSQQAPPTQAPTTRQLADGPVTFDANGEGRVPMSKIRKRTAINLKQAQNTAAILTTFNEVDMSAIMELRTKHKERFEKTYGIGLGFMSFFARAVVLGLREFPRVNAFIDGDDTVYHNYVNLGIAVSTDRGLAVPVLRNAEQMGFAKIESEIKRLATAVRDGKLGLQELSGGTFTITNGGVFGSLLSTPILNPPQSAILGMHTIQKRPVAVGDKVEVHPMMYVALSYDHRMVDGRESVSFLVRVKEYLEDPTRLMLEI